MILFLDFDGVLHPISGSNPFQPACVFELETVIHHFPSLEIVVTLSWREEKSMEELIALVGPVIGKRIIGTTPIMDDPFLHHTRYHEVMAYLACLPEQDRVWVAIDDEVGNYPPEMPVLIVDRHTGLTNQDRERLMILLQDQENTARQTT